MVLRFPSGCIWDDLELTLEIVFCVRYHEKRAELGRERNPTFPGGSVQIASSLTCIFLPRYMAVDRAGGRQCQCSAKQHKPRPKPRTWALAPSWALGISNPKLLLKHVLENNSDAKESASKPSVQSELRLAAAPEVRFLEGSRDAAWSPRVWAETTTQGT